MPSSIDPVVVFLDEPTLGLDPRGQQELLELIQHIAARQNAGVVLCSHLLSEVEGVCDDVVILNLGQIVAKGTVSDVIEQVQKNVLLNYTFAASNLTPARLKSTGCIKNTPFYLKC